MLEGDFLLENRCKGRNEHVNDQDDCEDSLNAVQGHILQRLEHERKHNRVYKEAAKVDDTNDSVPDELLKAVWVNDVEGKTGCAGALCSI